MHNKYIDRQIAEKIMGWIYNKGKKTLIEPDSLDNYPGIGIKHWSPSTNIAHAWQVIERMRTTHFKWFEMTHRPNGYVCNFSGDPRHTEFEKTAPLAICKAALKIIEEK